MHHTAPLGACTHHMHRPLRQKRRERPPPDRQPRQSSKLAWRGRRAALRAQRRSGSAPRRRQVTATHPERRSAVASRALRRLWCVSARNLPRTRQSATAPLPVGTPLTAPFRTRRVRTPALRSTPPPPTALIATCLGHSGDPRRHAGRLRSGQDAVPFPGSGRGVPLRARVCPILHRSAPVRHTCTARYAGNAESARRLIASRASARCSPGAAGGRLYAHNGVLGSAPCRRQANATHGEQKKTGARRPFR